MLRRAPTAITLTPEDIAAYEDSHAARLAKASATDAQAAPTAGHGLGQNAKSGMVVDPNDELKPLPGDKGRGIRVGEGRAREERIMGR